MCRDNSYFVLKAHMPKCSVCGEEAVVFDMKDNKCYCNSDYLRVKGCLVKTLFHKDI